MFKAVVFTISDSFDAFFPFSPTGRPAEGERSADRRQRGISFGQNQPGRHGDAAQVHVDGRQQTRVDPADRGQTGDQEERGEEAAGRRIDVWRKDVCYLRRIKEKNILSYSNNRGFIQDEIRSGFILTGLAWPPAAAACFTLTFHTFTPQSWALQLLLNEHLEKKLKGKHAAWWYLSLVTE